MYVLFSYCLFVYLRWAYVTERQRPHVADIHVVPVSRRSMLADIFASPRPAVSFLPFRNSVLGSSPTLGTMPPKDDISYLSGIISSHTTMAYI